MDLKHARSLLAAALLVPGLVLLALAAGTAAARAEARIVWRVENGFRLFTDPARTEMHRATYAALSDSERRHPVLAAERLLAERHNGEGWAASVVADTCWDAARNRYACKAQPNYLTPKLHRIITQLDGVEDAAGVDCIWLTAPRGRNPGRGQSVTLPCDTPAKLEIPYPAGAGVTVEIGAVRVAEVEVRVSDLLIVGLGDSFGSGEGNPDIAVRFSRERAMNYGDPVKDAEMTGFPARVGDWVEVGDKAFVDNNARWLDQACHRSLYSHQVRAALQLAIEDPHRAVTFAGFACSGAEITDGLFLRYKGHEWVPTPPEVSQISAAAQAQCGAHPALVAEVPEAYHLTGKVPELQGLSLKKCDPEHARRIDLVLLSIGGNDVGFARLVANAVLADKSLLRRVGGWFGEVYGFTEAVLGLDRLDDRYKTLNRAIHNILHVPWAEPDRIVLTAYPALTLLEDGRSICPDGRAGMTAVADFVLSEQKARDSMTAAERLDGIMQDASRAHGWTFVETHRDAFRGRSICSGWADNALTSADDLRLPRKLGARWEPYNPADWKPYAPRQRWFRTPNDAFLTGNFHVSKTILQKALPSKTLSWVQVVLASLYSGAFHPTAEGQAAIADAVVVEARRVLAKYEQKSDARRIAP